MMSGLAAAERLGADYPFPHDKLASAQVCVSVAWCDERYVRQNDFL
jgi:hypothetical protein